MSADGPVVRLCDDRTEEPDLASDGGQCPESAGGCAVRRGQDDRHERFGGQIIDEQRIRRKRQDRAKKGIFLLCGELL